MPKKSVPPSDQQSDIATIGHPAKNAAERRLGLDRCLNGPWVTADIWRIERIDNQKWHGWVMWVRGSNPKPPNP